MFLASLSVSLLFSAAFAASLHAQDPLREQHHGGAVGPETKADADAEWGPLDAAFDRLVGESMEFFNVPGLSVAVVEGDETFAKGYGTAVFPSTNATPDTLYYVGSTTKSFTAAAILLLIEDSANSSSPLKLTTPISELIREEFVLPDEYATRKATLEDLLSHRTGMPRHDMSYGGLRQPTLKELVMNLRNLPMTKDLRTQFQYCNMMFSTLAYVIEKLTSLPLGYLFQERIWKPLGMTNTYSSLADAQEYANASLSRGYYYDNSSDTFIPEPYLSSPIIFGAGNIISSVADFSRYLHALLKQDTFLSPVSHAELRFPRSISQSINVLGAKTNYTPWSSPELYSLGWQLQNYRGVQVYSHAGAVTGYGAQMAYAPQLDWAFVSMANTEISSNVIGTELMFRFLDERLGVPQQERFDWKRAWNESLERAKNVPKNARKLLYPTAPNPGRPLALPLQNYTGTYANAGYGNITLVLDPGSTRLRARITDKTWNHQIELEHVSGEYFIAWLDYVRKSPNAIFQGLVGKAEFRLAEDGGVGEWGIQYEPTREENIWFKKVE